MARYYAEIQGNRGEASRMGTASSGIYGHIRGWNVGARVDCHTQGNEYGLSSDRDWVNVQLTGGSSGYWRKDALRLREDAKGKATLTFFPPDGSEPLTYRKMGDRWEATVDA